MEEDMELYCTAKNKFNAIYIALGVQSFSRAAQPSPLI